MNKDSNITILNIDNQFNNNDAKILFLINCK